MLEQSVYDEIFTMLVSEYFRSQSDHSTNPSSKVTTLVERTSDELNAMRYACSYVPCSLLKKYETKSGNVYSQFVQCLGDMAVEEGDDLLTYTTKWFDRVNRGGLSMTTHTLFIEIEKCVRVVLPKHPVCGDSDKASFKKSVLDVIVKHPVLLDFTITRHP